MKKNLIFLSIICFLALISTAQAIPGKFDVSLYAGVSHNYLNPGPLILPGSEGIYDKLMPDELSENNFMPGFGVSYIAPMPQNVPSWLNSYRLGLDMFFLNRGQSGMVYQYSDPRFNNYFYNLKVNTARLMFAGQLIFAPWKTISPFVEAAIGGARIDSEYNEHPNFNEGIFEGDIHLGSHVQYNFVYSLGAGLSVPLTNRLTGSLGYQFTDLGHVKTSSFAVPGNVNITPIDSRFASNAVYLKLSCTLN